MKDAALIGPLLPLAVPLIGAGVSWIVPSGPVFLRIRRWLCVLALVSTCVLLLAARAHEPRQVALSLAYPHSAYHHTIQFRFTDLGVGFGFLLSGVLALAGISRLAYPMERSEAVSLLVGVLAGVWTTLAGNLLALCLGWTLMDLALLSGEVVRAPEENIPHAIRRALVNSLSSVALVVATVLVMTEHGQAHLSNLPLTGIAPKLLMLAALLRLGVYPLPGSLKRRWPAHVASLCTGGYLWLRLVSLCPGELAGFNWLVVLCGLGLLAGGLLAALSGNWVSAWRHVLLGEVAALVLAPLLDPAVGSAVAWIMAINAALCVVLVGIDGQVQSTAALGRWSRLPRGIGMASLRGWPLTLGFTAHWCFVRLCLVTGLRGLALLASLAYLFASVPMWRWLDDLRRPGVEDGDGPGWSGHLARAALSLGALFLVFHGIGLALSARVWPGLPGELQLDSLGVLYRGESKFLGVLALAATVGPLLGSYALHRLRVHIPDRWSRALDVGSTLLELDWLYLAVERVVARLQRLVEQASAAVEGPFYLGWTLFWGIVFALYLMGA